MYELIEILETATRLDQTDKYRYRLLIKNEDGEKIICLKFTELKTEKQLIEEVKNYA